MQINMNDTNRDLVRLISVILLLNIIILVLHKYDSPAVLCEKTPQKAISTTLPSRFVGILFTFTSSSRTCSPAKKSLDISRTTEMVSATSK